MLKQERERARNLKLGAVYFHDSEPKRLDHIIACQGVWLIDPLGDGYGDLVPFDEVGYADSDEVQDFVDDCEVARVVKAAAPLDW
jgi:hypothetical protein